MKYVELPSPTGGDGINTSVVSSWDERNQCWLVLVASKRGCKGSRAISEPDALRRAVDKIFESFVGYNKDEYDHDAVWRAYQKAQKHPDAFLPSVPV